MATVRKFLLTASAGTRRNAALAGVVLVGLLVRLPHLNSSLWYDETFASRLKLSFSLQGLAWMAYDTHPPLYNSLMLVWNHLFGESEISLRLLPLVSSVAAIVLTARLAIRLGQRQSALLAAAVFAISGASVYYAQEARSYSFIVLLFLITLNLLLQYSHAPKSSTLHWLTVFCFLCAISHLVSLILVFCLMAALLWRAADQTNARGVMRLAMLQVALAVPFYFFIALMVLFTREHSYLSEFTDHLGGGNVAHLSSFFLFGYGGADNYGFAHWVVLSIVVIGLVLLLASAKVRVSSETSRVAPTFESHFTTQLFWLVCSAGLMVSVGLSIAPRFISPEWISNHVSAGDHEELLVSLGALVGRTARLYAVGYAVLMFGWLAISKRQWMSRVHSLWPEHRSFENGAKQAVLLFPVIAVAVIAPLSYLRAMYNSRYMLPILPLAVIAVATAISRIPTRAVQMTCAVGLIAVQAWSIAAQRQAYDFLKPDYKGALQAIYRSGWAKYPVSDTAEWELENVGQYYARREGHPPLHRVDAGALSSTPEFTLIVPDRFPLSALQFAPVAKLISDSADVRQIRFGGLMVYNVRRSDAEMHRANALSESVPQAMAVAH